MTLPLVTIGTALAQTSVNDFQARAGLNIASLNRAQQAHYLELGKFAVKIQDLGIDPSRINSADYLYSLSLGRTSTLQYAIARRRNLKSYVGRVAVIRHSNGEATTTAIVCENNRLWSYRPATPRIDTNLKLIGPTSVQYESITIAVVCENIPPVDCVLRLLS